MTTPIPKQLAIFPRSKPPLKWVGGKRWLVRQLRELITAQSIPPDYQLVDVFTGGMSIPLGLIDIFGDQAIANDANPLLINFYREIQSGRFKYESTYENNPLDFLAARKRFNILNKTVAPEHNYELCQLFYYLSRTSFNGLFRMSKLSNYNTPFGQYKSVDYDRDFSQLAADIQGWQFSATDFSEVVIDKESVIYADPPYYGSGVFTGYGSSPFLWEEQVRLAHWLAAQPGMKIASNYPAAEIVELYGDLGFEINLIESRISVAAKSSSRKPIKEMLAIKRS